MCSISIRISIDSRCLQPTYFYNLVMPSFPNSSTVCDESLERATFMELDGLGKCAGIRPRQLACLVAIRSTFHLHISTTGEGTDYQSGKFTQQSRK
ncbi:hypothetical protein BCIN_15g00150 [Botrytis cinerea B05.10]|uniref:Uncharacterized protein n=1 Tax=Botryotinia fuckeliana (strain B05.10) TaxID=332648 RepID=A0A384K469_BOTFB|nr:hypothetical protein BCIN_15g00150 [Botrytis cinerea B05.10]ATZ57434.1 hypothetical protein BCIN_15g00150 [Botrytis cinerea B05.10]